MRRYATDWAKTGTDPRKELSQEVEVDLTVRVVEERIILEQMPPGMPKTRRMLPKLRRSHCK